MLEEQFVFWVFTSIFGILSIVKTLRKYWDAQAEEKNGNQTAESQNNDEEANNKRHIHTSNIRRLFTVSDKYNEQIDSISSNLPNVETETIDFKHLRNFRKTNKKHLVKSMINYSITFNSSFMIVGGLTESYLYGVRMASNIIAVVLGHLYSLAIIFPFMYSLDEKCHTPYDYLKLRYNNREFPKLACLLVAMFYYFSFCSLYLWGCAAIINVLIPELNLQMTNAMLGVYSMSGTILGGYIQSTKTNVIQFLIAFFGILFAMKLTLTKEKGLETFEKVWDLAKANNRTTFFDTNVDFTTRYTILNQILSLPLPWCSKLGLFLPNYIRYRSICMKSKAKALFLSNIPLTIIINMILILAGSFFCFAFFYGCDPHLSAKVVNKNQIGIYWVHMTLSKALPSLSGIVFSCIVYFALIQHSIGMAIISKTLYDELLQKLPLNHKSQLKLKNAIPILLGLASIPYSALFQFSKNTMLSLFFVFNNSLNSPILGLFLLSMFNPYANHVGAISAFLLNIFVNFWMVMGSMLFSRTKNQEFVHNTLYCMVNSNSTSSISVIPTAASRADEELYPRNQFLYFMFSVTPVWYCLFSVLFNLILGSLFSLIYSIIKTKTLDADSKFAKEREKLMFFYRLKNHF